MTSYEDMEKVVVRHIRKHPTKRYSKHALMQETSISNSYGMDLILRSLYSQKKISKIAAMKNDGEYVETYGVPNNNRNETLVF